MPINKTKRSLIKKETSKSCSSLGSEGFLCRSAFLSLFVFLIAVFHRIVFSNDWWEFYLDLKSFQSSDELRIPFTNNHFPLWLSPKRRISCLPSSIIEILGGKQISHVNKKRSFNAVGTRVGCDSAAVRDKERRKWYIASFTLRQIINWLMIIVFSRWKDRLINFIQHFSALPLSSISSVRVIRISRRFGPSAAGITLFIFFPS